ncbi:hypothetical protein BT96DRAFT_817778 [Gymnopus androsaceus JB14]|uniref:Uncharacterized protein n=1 Tax=Gymnopus androsaceus JB14 TaxID=1447944 RepID=A0A6A4HXI8_9AGAR|nr:hypothetical protein BT96DRAFT_817778 [Gymnopus androsaceus JB14]
MVAQIKKAAAGLYHAKQFNEKDRDLAQLLRHISGGSGLFAASHGCGLPSLSTAKRVTPTPPITPSPSTPRLDEIIANLRLSYPPLKPGESVERAGQVLMMDGIATTARIRRLRKTDEMVGLCREHTGGLNLSMDSFDSILKVRDAVHGDHPTCHYGKETTVAVFAPFQSTNYYPRPALLSPTCKAERAPDFAIFVALLIQGYGIVAEKIYGDLWVISTDGDAVFRLGCNQLCLVQELPQNHPLYELLCGMPGLNLTCGENFITYSSDFKHNNKRCATLCRSNQGIMIGNHIINAEMLSRLLLLLPGQTKESVEGLLDPDDHQNVPRAIKLLIAIHRLSDVNTSGLNPLDKDLLRYIAVLGALFDAFIQPFMQQEWSLYEQLKSLAIAGHLLFGLYRSHTTSFMSNQLYHDMHSVIKSIYFCVAKQKLLDNTKDIYIFQNASDRIESLFRETRTRDHNTNPDVLGLSQNVAMATDRAKIFERRPNMKQSSRRLSYDGSEGIDHVNPGYFTGDLCVGHVELPKPFRDAKFAASEVLTKAGLSFDFDGILAEEGVDFLRPFGGNVYPGLSLDHDRSIPDDSLDSSNRTTSSAPASASDVKAELEDSETDNLLHLDDFLGPDPDHPDTITTSENIPSDSLHVTQDDGTVIQMNKLLLLSTMFKDGKLSKDRIRRARGFTMPTKVEEDDDIPLGDDTLQVRDVAVCPVRLGDTIALAVLTVTGLERKGKKHLISVGESELRDSKMDVFVSGQILNLCEYPFENIPSEGDSEPSFTTRWAWTGSFASFAPLKSLQSPIGSTVPEDGSRKSHVIRIPGRFVFAVCPGTTQLLLDDTRPFAQDLRLNGLDVTSWISHDVLIDIKETEFGSMKAEEFGILPRLGASETLPYRDSEGRKSFILEEPTQELVRKKNASSEKLDCYQCGAAIDVSLLRSHVGAHILLAMTGVIEPNLQEPISNPGHACGFCGRSCDGLEMKVLARERQYRFSCPRKQTFKYVSALKPTKRQPSTNVPVYCTLCPLPLNSSSPPTFWKYSIFAHIREMHPHHWDINTRKPFNLPKEMDTVKIDELEVEMILKAAHVGSRLPISTSIVSLPFTISTTSSNTSKRSQPPVDRGGNKRQKEK